MVLCDGNLCGAWEGSVPTGALDRPARLPAIPKALVPLTTPSGPYAHVFEELCSGT